ncbi:MAG: glycosyltransferase [Bacteroidetes bacterium]|jgi:glycosyltransferase involved in cell wall biosynthesis|nr:glycosyltransferase [Bacteroidota bacterium]
MIRILHIIDSISGAGPARALISLAKYASDAGLPQQHSAIALKKEAYPVSLLFAKRAGLDILRNPEKQIIRNKIKQADIVQVHYWNNPAMTEFIRSDWPSMRCLIWFMVYGKYSPQVISKELLDYSDFSLGTSPNSLKLPVFKDILSDDRADFVYGLADWARLENIKKQPHDNFNVGYIGTVNFTKMHPNYIPMSVKVSVPDVKFVVCGGGIEEELKAQANSLDSSEKFEFHGYVENIRSVLEKLDVFGYPLCEDTYATSEKSIQEAMFAGVPPVVFPYGGCSDLVQHGETGLVVENEKQYAEAIEYLYHNPEYRTELGRNAAEYARREFDSNKAVQKMQGFYEKIMAQPKRKRRWRETEVMTIDKSPSEIFVDFLGDQGFEFKTSLNSSDRDQLLQADKKIACSSPLLVGGEGGINQYRNHYPEDPYLRLWSGLCLQTSGEHQKAISEFETAIELGMPAWRAKWYMARSSEVIGNLNKALSILEEILNEDPGFNEADSYRMELIEKKN